MNNEALNKIGDISSNHLEENRYNMDINKLIKRLDYG